MIARLIAAIFGTKNDRELKRLWQRVKSINDFEDILAKLTDEELKHKTTEFRKRLAEGQALDDLLPEAFAVVREASKRTLGMRHYDVQMIGGMVLHEGKISEMRTGEGKTLVSTLPLYLNALAGRGAHLVTVNDYLVRRDAEWMGPIYAALGLSVGIIQNSMNDAERRVAYGADITYGTNNEYGFDYLRDNMKFDLKDYVQRDLHYAIVDEVDSILIDEARTPLIISGAASKSGQLYTVADAAVRRLERGVDYDVDEKARAVNIHEVGIDKIEHYLRIDNMYAAENVLLLHHIHQALKAHAIFKLDVDYVVADGQVMIVDEFTGRILHGRRYSDGLHQAIEAKEGVEIERETQTHATITLQNYFRMYKKLAGMTGTAQTEAAEFHKIYKLGVITIPTHRVIARVDEDDALYLLRKDKFEAVVKDITECYHRQQPVLVGTASIETSEYVSALLARMNIPHKVLNAKNHEKEADIIKEAGEKGRVTIATNMAGRGTDIKLGAGVVELGGLRVIGTERHESRRIDNQLRGRSGRQGDPGSSKFYISFEDDLIRIFGGEKAKARMIWAGMKPGECIEDPMFTRVIEHAQQNVELHNFDVRKHLLEYDDVMNKQRSVVYQYRREILSLLDGSHELVKEFVGDIVEHCIERFATGKTLKAEQRSDLFDYVCEVTGLTLEQLGDAKDYSFNAEKLESELTQKLLYVHQLHREQLPPEMIAAAEKWLMLETVDFAWRTHLSNLDQIKDGINFRGYAQRDPLIEYKKEAFWAFERMMLEIKLNIISSLYKLNVSQVSQNALAQLEEARKAELEELSMIGASESADTKSQANEAGNRKARRARSKKGGI